MDKLTIVIIGIGIFVCISTFIETKKQKQKVAELVKLHKCKEYSYYKKPMFILGIMTVLCLIIAILGFNNENETTLNLGILLSFLFLSETYRSYFVLRIYHNDKGIITNDQFLRIKSIKTMYKNSSLPFSKWSAHTFNGNKLTIVSKVGQFIEENYKDEIIIEKK